MTFEQNALAGTNYLGTAHVELHRLAWMHEPLQA
jgi:hypothetical protein